MTSSLVGSEMCIRDSSSCVPPPEAVAHSCKATLASGSLRLKPHWASPVSYTHLTLPTICSV
eukprot:5378245-Prorocentrum_lima.AAC.1